MSINRRIFPEADLMSAPGFALVAADGSKAAEELFC